MKFVLDKVVLIPATIETKVDDKYRIAGHFVSESLTDKDYDCLLDGVKTAISRSPSVGSIIKLTDEGIYYINVPLSCMSTVLSMLKSSFKSEELDYKIPVDYSTTSYEPSNCSMLFKFEAARYFNEN